MTRDRLVRSGVARLLVRVVVAVASVGGVGIVAAPRIVFASCMTGSVPTVSVSGVVVSTSIASNEGLVVTVRSDDGATHAVRFFGRDPSETLPNGVENTFEDAWDGELPQQGGRYVLTGAEPSAAGDPIDLNSCVPGASVQQLGAPSTSAATEVALTTTATGATEAATRTASTTAAVLIGALLGGGVLVYLMLRRSS